MSRKMRPPLGGLMVEPCGLEVSQRQGQGKDFYYECQYPAFPLASPRGPQGAAPRMVEGCLTRLEGEQPCVMGSAPTADRAYGPGRRPDAGSTTSALPGFPHVCAPPTVLHRGRAPVRQRRQELCCEPESLSDPLRVKKFNHRLKSGAVDRICQEEEL